MRIFTLAAALLSISAPLLQGTPAEAQPRTWVSGAGNDANPCTRSAPCATFGQALANTDTSGVINCLDPGGFGTVNITRSIEINCLNTHGGILAFTTNGVIVNAAGITVVLRGLSIEGAGSGANGVKILTASTVHIEKSTIRGFRGGGSGNANGIKIENTSGLAKVYISDTNITDNGTASGGAGVLNVPTGPAFSFVMLHNVNINNNTYGVANTANGRMRITRSAFAGNTTGVQGDPGSVVQLNDTDIVLSNTAISGATVSFGNNRISGNNSEGTPPTPNGAPSNDLGQK